VTGRDDRIVRDQPMSAGLHFESALLPDGWAANVRVEIAAGRFASVQPDVQPQPAG
jgi:hypothetical protein